ncbi:MAG: NAD(P)H-dependent oxidoreductase, partial [Pseudomonadota bacterium]
MTPRPLRLLMFLGSVRDSAPPRPRRLGERVARACAARLAAAGHDVALIDPLALDLPQPFKPHFAYAPGQAPEALQTLAEKIEAADGYVMVSPEYNHAMSPALMDLPSERLRALFPLFSPPRPAGYCRPFAGGLALWHV